MTIEKSLYLQPETWEALIEAICMMTESSAVLAGGTDLIPKLRDQEEEPDIYLSLGGMKSLKEISVDKGWLRIGAMVTHDQAVGDPSVKKYFNALRMACQRVGSQQIRNKGTLCGSIANASPAGDIMPCVFLFGGEIEILGMSGVKRVGAEAFLDERGKRKLSPNEIITAIYLPMTDGLESCFIKLGSRREVTIAQISLCAAWKKEAIKAYVGAVDVKPVLFDGRELLAAADKDVDACESAARRLSDQIREIRLKRQRESKLKLTEAEKQYKENAAKGVILEMAETMGSGPKPQ